MYYALDDKGNRVHIVDAIADTKYICPVCNSEVVQKKGKVNAWHYSHKTTIECDEWYKVGEWHSEWQSRFPERYREIIIRSLEGSHRADVKVDNLIIEFQDSSIASALFEKKNNFYTKYGHLVWIFDVRNKNIVRRREQSGITVHYKWSWAYKFSNLESYGKEFDLFLQIEDDKLVRVVWNKTGFKFFGGYEYTKEQCMTYLRTKYRQSKSNKKYNQ